MKKSKPSPEQLAREEASRLELARHHSRRAFSPDERALMIKALLAYAGMVPLEEGVRAEATRMVEKLENE